MKGSSRVYYAIFAFLIVVVVSGHIALWDIYQKLNRQDNLISENNKVIAQMSELSLAVLESESKLRAYLLTTQERYLADYQNLQKEVWIHYQEILKSVAVGNRQQEALEQLRPLLENKANLTELLIASVSTQIDIAQRDLYLEEARRLIVQIQSIALAFDLSQKEYLLRREMLKADYDNSLFWVFILVGLSSFCVIGVSIILLKRTSNLVDKERAENELRTEQGELSLSLAEDLLIDEAGGIILDYLAKNFDVLGARIFQVEKDTLKEFGSLGLDSIVEKIDIKESFLGKIIENKRIAVINDVPSDYWCIKSGLGEMKPKSLLVLPFSFQGKIVGLIEMARFKDFEGFDLRKLEALKETLGVGIGSALSRTQIQTLLEKTQLQTEELQSQQEELQAYNEELEQQARELELQQENLALKNKDLVEAHTKLREKAEQIRKTSQYKSEFLANMSHELRTPLNSLLILSSLLAENKDKNLSAKQVEFAQSIFNSGNDLLLLIDDILDLSKVEANKVRLNITDINLESFVNHISETFKPQIDKKKIGWEVIIDDSVKDSIFVSDEQRVGQVLKNFISNAIKFTEAGKVSLEVKQTADQFLKFSVVDTGVGIPKEKKEAIFEAFEQVDGSISRKYGGTGLGLSIAKKFSELLGGRIEMDSTEGQGSVFSFVLPLEYQSNRITNDLVDKSREEDLRAKEVKQHKLDEDAIEEAILEKIKDFNTDDEVILIVEDDEIFRESIVDVVKSFGFKPLEASDGEEAISLLNHYIPSAVLLDIKIPKISGMGVLEMIKKRSDLRHLPVHMISGINYQQNALRLGALGYLTKPVSVEKVQSAVQRIRNLLTERVRKVLLVEDDMAQQLAVTELINDKDLEVVVAKDAKEALEILESQVIDCVILDLNLPDMTGIELLRKMKSLDLSIPPVIIYTAKNLTPDEELKLRQLSESIVIKSVRSVERLFNEVNLFVHRVESILPDEKRKILETVRSYDNQFKDRRVLLVDDDLRNVFALTSALENQGFQVEIAQNGLEALEKLEANGPYDVVLMDIMMPEMDGHETMKRIRSAKAQWMKKIPIIALTAKAMREDYENAINAGANDYLAKPINLTNLMTVLKVWLPEETFLR